MPTHADDDRPIESRVGLAVAALIEAMPTAGLAGSGGDRTDPAQLGEGGLIADPIVVVAAVMSI
jgi:hypothetical protein